MPAEERQAIGVQIMQALFDEYQTVVNWLHLAVIAAGQRDQSCAHSMLPRRRERNPPANQSTARQEDAGKDDGDPCGHRNGYIVYTAPSCADLYEFAEGLFPSRAAWEETLHCGG